MRKLLALLLSLVLLVTLTGCDREDVELALDIAVIVLEELAEFENAYAVDSLPEHMEGGAGSLAEIPAFTGIPYISVNDNVPLFLPVEAAAESFECYSELDELGRCGTAVAVIGRDLMPKQEREDISSVRPTGWHSVKYDRVEGGYLYNRCHLIGFQLAGENANEKNLITGTRYLNIEGMLPFENLVADYVKETGNHVLYRVTPIFREEDLVAQGVLMEGYSVEDQGRGVCFCVYAYNAQPGIRIDYTTGKSREVTK